MMLIFENFERILAHIIGTLIISDEGDEIENI